MAKILILDIETAPNLAFVWKTWKENISTDQLIEPSFIMSYSAKWLGEEEIFYAENRHKDDSELIKNLCSLVITSYSIHYTKLYEKKDKGKV